MSGPLVGERMCDLDLLRPACPATHAVSKIIIHSGQGVAGAAAAARGCRGPFSLVARLPFSFTGDAYDAELWLGG